MAKANVVIKRVMGRPPSYEVWSYPALTISPNAPWDFTICREQARCQHGQDHQIIRWYPQYSNFNVIRLADQRHMRQAHLLITDACIERDS